MRMNDSETFSCNCKRLTGEESQGKYCPVCHCVSQYRKPEGLILNTEISTERFKPVLTKEKYESLWNKVSPHGTPRDRQMIEYRREGL